MNHSVTKIITGIACAVIPFFAAYGELPAVAASGNNLVLQESQEVIRLKGIDINNQSWGEWIWPLSDSIELTGKDPMIRLTEFLPWFVTDADLPRLENTGCNCIRYAFCYEIFASDNPKKEKNLQTLQASVASFASIAMYTILNCHYPPGLDISNISYEGRFHGDVREQSVFESDSLYEFWAAMWEYIAEACKGNSNIAGFELVTEPCFPSSNTGTIKDYIARYTDLVQRIRAIDPDRMIIIPEYECREAEIGEKFWYESDNGWIQVVDTGQQGIVWESVPFVLGDSIENIAYVFHCYEPYEFSHEGIKTFNAQEVEQYITAKHAYFNEKNRPVLCTEYGVNYLQNYKNNLEQKVKWYNIVHTMFDTLRMSSTIYTYKNDYNPWVTTFDSFQLRNQLVTCLDFVTVAQDSFYYVDEETKQAAEESGFHTLFPAYFFKNGNLDSVSLMGNEPILAELQRYCGISPIKHIIPATLSHTFPVRKIGHSIHISIPNTLFPCSVSLYDLRGRSLYHYTHKQAGRPVIIQRRMMQKGLNLAVFSTGDKKVVIKLMEL